MNKHTPGPEMLSILKEILSDDRLMNALNKNGMPRKIMEAIAKAEGKL